jgi:hypothetical protein
MRPITEGKTLAASGAETEEGRRPTIVSAPDATSPDRGGMRRAWLRGRENIAKRYLIHVAGFNLGVLMRALMGRGTPRELVDAARGAILFVVQTDFSLAIAILADLDGVPAMITVILAPEPH